MTGRSDAAQPNPHQGSRTASKNEQSLSAERKPWVAIPDDLGDDPRHVAAGPAASGAWVWLTGWSHRQGTDGAVPAAIAQRFCGDELNAMLTHGLLIEDGDGYQLADYLTYQETEQERLAAKMAYHEQQVSAGKASARSQGHHTSRGTQGRFTKTQVAPEIPWSYRTIEYESPSQTERPPNATEPNTDTDTDRREVEVSENGNGDERAYGASAPTALKQETVTSVIEELCRKHPESEADWIAELVGDALTEVNQDSTPTRRNLRRLATRFLTDEPHRDSYPWQTIAAES